MKLEVGMYVRFGIRNSLIAKIEELEDQIIYLDIDFYDDYNELTNCIGCKNLDEYNVKASHSLLGNDKEPCLIEVGDYVNGSKVIDIVGNDVFVSNFYEEQCIEHIRSEKIKSIVTKEQFERMEYRLGDNE